MKKFIKVALVIVVIAAVVVVGVKKIKEAKKASASQTVAKIYPIRVETIDPSRKEVQLTLPYLAVVYNDKDVKLASRISARVLSIKQSAVHVKKGEVIAKLDTTTIISSLNSVEHQLQAAKIALKNLQRTHQRTLKLLAKHELSLDQVQKEMTPIANTKAKIASLQEQKITLKNNLSYATIRSPINGVIAKVNLSVGSIAMPGKPILSIASKSGFYMMVRVPNQTPIKGVIYNKNRYEATPLGTTFHGLAEYKVYTGQSNMTTGDRLEVAIITFNGKATFLPFDAVLNRNGKSYVLVVKGDKAVPEQVHILQSGEQGLVVSDTLEGQKLVKAKPDILLKLLSGYKLKSIKG